ncbi:DUF881 domain-containing protein [Speluncibacter jeojiensis]|uniref:DUF881 domain-containing protein n=1 Tax=Speluncibacter jeojiensis TaxID=2710754 RepID=UPI00240F5E9D|nr:DUF881 domain-containing protein [Rhodococcus sp. D2-41]
MDVPDPATPRRNPTPSLLRSLLFDHLDPGYTAAARARVPGSPARFRTGAWIALGGVVIGVLFGVAAAQASRQAPDRAHVQTQLADEVRRTQTANVDLAQTRAHLSAEEESARERILARDSAGKTVLGALHVADERAAATAVNGPGLVVALADPTARPGLSGGAVAPGGAAAVVLDRDLQSVVNALWAGGAEAIGVGGVRIGPGVTIRQAGGAMLVDNQPISSPYVVSAIGPTATMQTGFMVSDAYLRMQAVHQLYGVGFTVTESARLSLPAAPVRELRYAREGTPR